MSVEAMMQMFKGKIAISTIALVLIVAYYCIRFTAQVTAKIGNEAHRIESNLDKRFLEQHNQIEGIETRLNKRMDLIQTQIDTAWTIPMQDLFVMMTAARNTNSWVPDSGRIARAVKAGQVPDPARISP